METLDMEEERSVEERHVGTVRTDSAKKGICGCKSHFFGTRCSGPRANELCRRALGIAALIIGFAGVFLSSLIGSVLMRLRFLLVLLVVAVFGMDGGTATRAQSLQVGVGGGWAVPTNNVEGEAASGETLAIDLKPGPHAYADAGLLWSLGNRFALGGRIRVQAARLRSEVDCSGGDCENPEGLLRAATLEGRLLFTSIDWIQPYFLVGLGVVNVTVDAVREPGTGRTYEEVNVTDAGGDVGLGASVPIFQDLFLDAEVRVTGTLPGGKENAVTALPFSAGLSYRF
jgi:opacity protein-like surface antigen